MAAGLGGFASLGSLAGLAALGQAMGAAVCEAALIGVALRDGGHYFFFFFFILEDLN
jgi:hypothetical protein